jgi:hypothetical protein
MLWTTYFVGWNIRAIPRPGLAAFGCYYIHRHHQYTLNRWSDEWSVRCRWFILVLTSAFGAAPLAGATSAVFAGACLAGVPDMME